MVINLEKIEAEKAIIGGEIVQVCNINYLIEMKKNAARPKDIEDIKHLKELLKMQKDEEHKK